MARRELINAILQSFQKLGGNLNDVLGTKTNVSFLGKGKSPEMMLDMDINEEALAILPQSKAVEELTGSVGYAVSNKLNDIQANKLLSNMKKMENVYFPPAEPKNVVDLATRTGDLDKAGLMSLRMGDDLPPPGSRGGPDDIAAPTQSADEVFRNMAKAEGVNVEDTILPTGKGLESIKNVQNNNLIVNELVDTIYLNAGVTPAAQPTVRANAREFLNRIKDLEDPEFPGGTTLSGVMEADDFRFMTEGGGGGLGDPLLLVQKYFGPKVAAAIAKIDNPNDIQTFAERLVRIKDGRGRSVTDKMFDPKTVNPEDFEFQDGGRVPFRRGGGADARYMRIEPKFLTMKGISEDPSLKVGGFGLDKHDMFYDKFGKFLNPLYYMEKFLEKGNKIKKADGGIIERDGYMAGMLVRGGKIGYQALRKYGIEGRDISRLFASLGTDKSLVGKEKTAYFQQLHKVLRNPDAFPDEIKDIQKQLGLDVGLGFKSGGLAKILEV